MADLRLFIPLLPQPFVDALEACAVFALEKYDVLAILASGTVLRGTGDPRSDLDVHVIHRDAFRERVQLFFAGVPCEIFVNPVERVRAYIEEEREDRRPMTAHMFSTGVAIYDPEKVLPELQGLADRSLADPVSADPLKLIEARYHAATQMEDVLDLADRDLESAMVLLGHAVKDLAECRVAAEPGWLPRGKDLLATLRAADPEAAHLAVAASGEGTRDQRIEAGRLLCLRVTGSEGFFEWKSKKEGVELQPTSEPELPQVGPSKTEK